MHYRHYLKFFLFTLIALVFIVIGINWVVDPYNIFNFPKINGFNAVKPAFENERMSKAYAVKYKKPRAIILGSSRSDIGIDPDHEGWSYEPVYNLSFPVPTAYEMLRYIQHANQIQPLKQVLLCFDFFNFRTDTKYEGDSSEARLSISYAGKPNFPLYINDITAGLLSKEALVSSLKTIRGKSNDTYQLDNGLLIWTMSFAGEYRNAFMASEAYYPPTYNPERYQFDSTVNGSPFDYYRQILQLAHRNNIDLRMAILPAHARHWEVLAAAGAWPEYEEWKHKLVTINEEEALLSQTTPFPLWDFGGYNEYTTEALPPAEDTTTVMKWWFESAHFTRPLGDLMLDKIFNYHDSKRIVPEEFGVLINSQNIEQDLAAIRAGRQAYRDTHPDDIADIESLFKESSVSPTTAP